jgi:hypothetical protein
MPLLAAIFISHDCTLPPVVIFCYLILFRQLYNIKNPVAYWFISELFMKNKELGIILNDKYSSVSLCF